MISLTSIHLNSSLSSFISKHVIHCNLDPKYRIINTTVYIACLNQFNFVTTQHWFLFELQTFVMHVNKESWWLSMLHRQTKKKCKSISSRLSPSVDILNTSVFEKF